MPSQTRANPSHHKDVIRAEFTRQADAYAAAPAITDAERLARLVAAINPLPGARALEVATGPGYVAMALAARCHEVVGLDLTPAPIAIAERIRRERGIENVRFLVDDAENLPFNEGEFDIVVCRFAFHHFEDPAAILAQMCRVCRAGGTVAVEDMFASEMRARADYWNQVERLRDHSHRRALALSELIRMMAARGIEVDRLHSDRLTPAVEDWMARAQTGADDAREVRRLLEDDMRNDLSGIMPFFSDGRMHFIQRTAALIGRKLRAS
ncbi:MAG: class I SAM-dependent methyltransferase [Candidatus Binataceae bacterium]